MFEEGSEKFDLKGISKRAKVEENSGPATPGEHCMALKDGARNGRERTNQPACVPRVAQATSGELVRQRGMHGAVMGSNAGPHTLSVDAPSAPAPRVTKDDGGFYTKRKLLG